MTARAAASGGDAVIKTAGRVFEVLEYMREVRRQVSVREIAERFGYPVSSTLVLLKSMAALGYLRHDPRAHAFFPTARLATLGDWIIDHLFQGGRLLQLLEEIARDTGQTAILAVENDIYAQYVQVILSGQAIQFNVQPGTRRLLCMSGLGWALLSTHGDDQVMRVVRRTQARLGTSGQRIDPDFVMAQVQLARRQGYAVSRNTVSDGVGIIALPLPAGEHGERLAVGVGGLVERLDRDRDAIVASIRERAGRDVAPLRVA